MPTHHAQTALRRAEQVLDDGQIALVHAQLETAAQIERVADVLTSLRNYIDGAVEGLDTLLKTPLVAKMVSDGIGMLFKVNPVTAETVGFDPENN